MRSPTLVNNNKINLITNENLYLVKNNLINLFINSDIYKLYKFKVNIEDVYMV